MTPRFKIGDTVCFQLYTKESGYYRLTRCRGVVRNVDTSCVNACRYSVCPLSENVDPTFSLSEAHLFTEAEVLWVVLRHGQKTVFVRHTVEDLVQ